MNKTRDYKLTVIVPVYNEEENMDNLRLRLGDFIEKSAVPSCVLFVNDGSSDNSGELLKNICAENKDFYYLEFEKNQGLSAAIKAGIDYTYSDYAGYIDADLQTDPEDFNKLIPYLGEYELVLGIRADRKDSFVKNASSKIANSFRRFMTNDGVSDTGCPLKIMNTEFAKKIPFFTGMHRFLPALIQLQNGRVREIPVRHYPRVAGESKFNLGNRLVSPFVDCFAYRWMKRRYFNYSVKDNNLEN
ncbi:MAG: glycosyltransferase family 2 protein [Rikenellaceae bacterium]|nr:glycosyltransferase family 2 protein [Rikenellaceae bacterium]